MSRGIRGPIVTGLLVAVTLSGAGCAAGGPIPIDNVVVDFGLFDSTALADPDVDPAAGVLTAEELPVAVEIAWGDEGVSQTYQVVSSPFAEGEVSSDGSFVLNNEWGFFAGRWPFTRTSRVIAGVEGSQLVVLAGVDEDLVFFVGGTEAHIVTNDGTETRWTDRDVFYSVGDDGVAKERRRSEEPDSVAFLDEVFTIAKAAGITIESLRPSAAEIAPPAHFCPLQCDRFDGLDLIPVSRPAESQPPGRIQHAGEIAAALVGQVARDDFELVVLRAAHVQRNLDQSRDLNALERPPGKVDERMRVHFPRGKAGRQGAFQRLHARSQQPGFDLAQRPPGVLAARHNQRLHDEQDRTNRQRGEQRARAAAAPPMHQQREQQ